MSNTKKIHQNAYVHPKAELGDGVTVGAFSEIGENVKIESGTKIGNSCIISGHTTIGKNCNIFTGSVIGSEPQDLKYKGEPTQVIIGDNNTIREYATVNRGTVAKGKTIIGSGNLLMAYAHIAHDCEIYDDTVIANVGTLAGHVTVENRVIIGGLAAVHQFVRLGRLSIIGGCSKVVQDIPPYSMVDGHPARVYGLNAIGLKRFKIPLQSIKYLKTAFRILFYMKLSTSTALKKIRDEIPEDPHITYLVNFIENSKRGLCKGAA